MNNNTIIAGVIVGGAVLAAAGAIAYNSGYNPLRKYATVVSVAQAYDTAQTPRIVMHEFGHSFTGLADEYTTPYPGFPPCSDTGATPNCEANVTNQTNAAQVKWRDWFSNGIAIPTPAGTSGRSISPTPRQAVYPAYRSDSGPSNCSRTSDLMPSAPTRICPRTSSPSPKSAVADFSSWLKATQVWARWMWSRPSASASFACRSAR